MKRKLTVRPAVLSALIGILAPTIAGVAGCTIIIQKGGSNPVPVPIPVPLICADQSTAPTAHVFFDTRIQRGTVNLAPYYAKWMNDTALALAAAKIATTEAVLIRADERPVDERVLAAWGCNLDDPRDLDPEEVLLHYATEPPPPAGPLGCATDDLVAVGEHLRDIVTRYPPELPGTSGLRVFGPAPSLVLVVHIDESARRTAYEDRECSGAKKLLSVGEQGNASWLAYAGDGVRMDRVIHWFITTDELVDRDTFVARCKTYDGFPSNVLDNIDASQEPLYGPLAQALDGAGVARVKSFPFCAMLVDTELAKYLRAEIHEIADIAGTEVDDDALTNILMGGGLPDGAGLLDRPPNEG